MKRRYRPRKQEKFLLYRDVPIEARLIEYIDYLKKTRQFVTVIKNSLRLFWTLTEGDTSVLTELFPQIVIDLKASAVPPPPPDTSGLERKIDQLQQAFLSGGAGSPNGLAMLPATTGGTIGSGMSGNMKTNFQVQAVVYDDNDDQDTVVIKAREVDPLQESDSWLEKMFAFQARPSTVDPDAPAMVSRPMNKRARSEADDDDLIVKVARAQ